MTTNTILRVLLRRWWLLILPLLVVLIYTFGTYRAPTTTYQVTMRFGAGLPPEPSANGSYSYDRHYNWLASEYIANGLADVVVTGVFAENIAKRLPTLNVTPAQLQGAIARDHKQSMTVIYVTWPEPNQLVTIANAITDELMQNSAAYFQQLSNISAAPLRQLDKPVPVAIAPPLRAQVDLPARLASALAVGLALALLAHVFDPFIRDEYDLAQTGMRAIGQIIEKK
jgi:capsular polysaccharide biosynthesis protein